MENSCFTVLCIVSIASCYVTHTFFSNNGIYVKAYVPKCVVDIVLSGSLRAIEIC